MFNKQSKETDKAIFERKQMEEARGWFLSNPYAYTSEEIKHGKEKKWTTEKSMMSSLQ